MHALSRELGKAIVVMMVLLPGCDKNTRPTPEPPTQSEETHVDEHDHHEHHGHMPHRFEDAEHWAQRFDDPSRDAWQKPADVIAAMAIEPGMTVADIGAGTGYFLGHLSEAVGPNGTVLGLDVEASLVTYMKKRAAESKWHNVEVRVIETSSPGADAASIDRFLIVNTWHHIDAREQYGATLAEALKPGGAVFIVEYDVTSTQGPPADHKLAPEQVIRELEASGLTAELLAEELPEQYIVRAQKL